MDVAVARRSYALIPHRKPSSPMRLTRLAVIIGAPAILSGCIARQPVDQPTLPGLAPAIEAGRIVMYAALDREPFPVPAVDVSEMDPRFLRQVVPHERRQLPGPSSSIWRRGTYVRCPCAASMARLPGPCLRASKGRTRGPRPCARGISPRGVVCGSVRGVNRVRYARSGMLGSRRLASHGPDSGAPYPVGWRAAAFLAFKVTLGSGPPRVPRSMYLQALDLLMFGAD